MFFAALVKAGERGLKRDLGAVFLVALHHAIREPQREGRVRISARSLNGKASFGDLRVRLLFRFGLRFDDLAHRAGVRIDQSREFDDRVAGRIHGGPAFAVKLLAQSDVPESGAAHQVGRALLRRFASQDFLHERVRVAELAGEKR